MTAWRLFKSGNYKELSTRYIKFLRNSIKNSKSIAYTDWRAKYVELNEKEKQQIVKSLKTSLHLPTFTILLKVSNNNSDSTLLTVESVLSQLYPKWVLNIPNHELLDTELKEKLLLLDDNRIHFSNVVPSDLNEWIIELDTSTLLDSACLYHLSVSIQNNPNILILYGDHDHINSLNEFVDPFFKPDWNADLFAAMNYMGPLIACEKNVWLSQREENSDQYSFLLKVTKDLSSEEIAHNAKILATSKINDDNNHLRPECKRVFQKLPEPEVKVSILIPTRDQGNMLERCLKSIFDLTDYTNYEIVLVDHESAEPKALEVINNFGLKKNFQTIGFSGSFNFAAMMNNAAKTAKGEVLVLLNNDTEIVDSGWLKELVSQVLRPEVGVVGALLLFSDGTIQHAGVNPDPEGFMIHGHKHRSGESSGYFSRLLAVHEVAAVTGACLAIEKNTWNMLDGMDEENFSVAYNDIDLCLKARHQGLKVIFSPYACLVHHESVSRGFDEGGKKNLRLQKELNVMNQRWGEFLKVDPAHNRNLEFIDGF